MRVMQCLLGLWKGVSVVQVCTDAVNERKEDMRGHSWGDMLIQGNVN